MANRFWVPGGTGAWSSTSNWSTTSGGASGAVVPTANDDVIVDALSGTSPTITISAPASCGSLTFTGAITPTLAGSSTLNVYGSLTRIAAMTWSYSGTLALSSSVAGKTITSAGGSYLGPINFSGSSVSGSWTLQDALSTNGAITLTVGILNTNGMPVSCAAFNINGVTARTLTLGASIVTCTAWAVTSTTNLTFNANTSTIIVTGSNTFGGIGLTYYNLTISGTTVTITGSNTFTTLTITAGKTANLTSGTTQTVTSLVCNGTTALPSTLQSVTAASAATIALPSGRYFIRHTSIKDITISGATAVTSIAGTNVSGNTGITFVTKFEMGRIKNDGSFNWYSAATGTVDKVSG